MWLFLGFHSIKTTTTIAYPLWDATPEKVASLYFVNFPLWFKFRLSFVWGKYIALSYMEIFQVWKLADLLSSHKFLGHIPKDPKETWQFTLLYTFFWLLHNYWEWYLPLNWLWHQILLPYKQTNRLYHCISL